MGIPEYTWDNSQSHYRTSGKSHKIVTKPSADIQHKRKAEGQVNLTKKDKKEYYT
jgi:hypothetical protein